MTAWILIGLGLATYAGVWVFLRRKFKELAAQPPEGDE